MVRRLDINYVKASKSMIKTIHKWKNICLVEQPITLPTGKKILHTTIVHPGACVILPIANNGSILVIRQFRPSLNKWLIELPAGTIEKDESPLCCARRELEEETGYQASQFSELGIVTPLAGFCDEIQHLYIAQGLELSETLNCDDDEVIEVLFMSVEELEQRIISGEVNDTKTIACLSKAKLCGFIR
jgi:ADP-ribose pyrophosphatase